MRNTTLLGLAFLTLVLGLLAPTQVVTNASAVTIMSIPIKNIGTTKDLNFQGYAFSFINNASSNNEQVPVNCVGIAIPIPSNLPTYIQGSDNVNAYAIWVALSPYPASLNSGKVFVQAGVNLFANTSGKYVQLFVVFVNGSNVYQPFLLLTYPFSEFAGTTLGVYLFFNDYKFTAEFNDSNGFSKTVTVTENFVPYSALIIGEDPQKPSGLYYYPLPNETFSNIQFFVVSNPATSVEVYTFEYKLNTPIPIAIAGDLALVFNWTYNGNSYSANAWTLIYPYPLNEFSFTHVGGLIQLAYKETPLLVGIIEQ